MRTLTTTLEAFQENNIAVLVRLVLTKGATTYTYYNDTDSNRIKAGYYVENGELQECYVLLDNTSKALSDVNLKMFQGVVSRGAKTSAGTEYSAKAPLWVDWMYELTDIPHGLMAVQVHLKGIFNWMQEEFAKSAYTLAQGDTQTGKTLMNAVAGATLAPFVGFTAYTIDWDDEDALADVVVPANSFKISKDDTRYSVMKKLLEYFDGVMRAEADGDIHVMRAPDNGESYLTGGDGYSVIYQSLQMAQTFTTDTNHTINGVNLLLFRENTPGTLTVGIYAVDGGGLPTGAALAEGTTNGDTLTTDTAGEWRKITFATPYALTTGTKYAIVLSVAASGSANRIGWVYDGSAPSYAGGNGLTASGAPLTWTAQAWDFLFAEVTKDYYAYELASGSHYFFTKGYNRRLISPNSIVVSSPPDEATIYTGTATDTADNTLRALPKPYEMHLSGADPNAQALSIATAILKRAQREGESGNGTIPPNVGQEMYDYIKITDVRDGTTRYGNIGYIKDVFNKKDMYISFGKPILGGSLGLLGIPDQNVAEATATNTERIEVIARMLEQVLAKNEDGVFINTTQLVSGDHHFNKRGTWTANSPAAGRVAWAGVSLVFKGVTYTITDSNTPLSTDKYIWWDFSTSTSAFQVSATRPTLTDDDALIAINDGGTPYLQKLETLIHGNVIRTGTVIADTLVATLVLSTTIVAGTVGGDRVELSSAGVRVIGDSDLIFAPSDNGTELAYVYSTLDSGDLALLPKVGSFIICLGPLSIGSGKNFGMLMATGADVEATWFDDGSHDYTLAPLTNNVSSLGVATRKWKNVFCTTLGSSAAKVTTGYFTTLGGTGDYITVAYITDIHVSNDIDVSSNYKCSGTDGFSGLITAPITSITVLGGIITGWT